jgi:drug/metabolite transporter (DMT)-like permease
MARNHLLPGPSLPALDGLRQGGTKRVVGAGLLLGTLGVFLHEAGQPPLTAVWFRCAFGALALLAWAACTGQLGTMRLGLRASAVACATGLLMVLSWALFFGAIQRTSIAVATVVFHVQPFWVMALGAWWLRERVSGAQWAATAIALLGLALASGLSTAFAGAATGGLAQTTAIGVAMCLGGSLCYALVTLAAQQWRVASPLALTWWQLACGTLVLAPWPMATGLPPLGATWAWLAGLGVIHTGLAYVMLYAGLARMAAGRAALLQFVYPAAAIAVDAWVYGRRLDDVQLLGVALLAGALMAARSRSAPRRPAREGPGRGGRGPDRPAGQGGR